MCSFALAYFLFSLWWVHGLYERYPADGNLAHCENGYIDVHIKRIRMVGVVLHMQLIVKMTEEQNNL